jgi:hypothetical protein
VRRGVPRRKAGAAAHEGFLWTHRRKPPGWWGRKGSVSAESARRDDCLEFREVQLADRALYFAGRTVLNAVRQAVEPCGVLNLCFDQTGDVIVPAPGPAAMIERAARVDYRCSLRARSAIAGLTFGIGHGHCTDRFAWTVQHFLGHRSPMSKRRYGAPRTRSAHRKWADLLDRKVAILRRGKEK